QEEPVPSPKASASFASSSTPKPVQDQYPLIVTNGPPYWSSLFGVLRSHKVLRSLIPCTLSRMHPFVGMCIRSWPPYPPWVAIILRRGPPGVLPQSAAHGFNRHSPGEYGSSEVGSKPLSCPFMCPHRYQYPFPHEGFV